MAIFDFSDYEERKKKKKLSQVAGTAVSKGLEKKKTTGTVFDFSDYQPRKAPKSAAPTVEPAKPSRLSQIKERLRPVGKYLVEKKEQISKIGREAEKPVEKAITAGLGKIGVTPQEVEEFHKKYENTILGQFSSQFQAASASYVEGFSGGLLKAEHRTPDNVTEKISDSLFNISGQLSSLKTIGTIFDGLFKGTIETSKLINRFPKVARVAYPLIKNAAIFDVYGQLNTEGKDRFRILAEDTLKSIPYTATGFIKSAKLSIPASFTVGFGMAKLDGASDEDAFISGAVLGVFDALGRVGTGKSDFVTGRRADKIMKVESIETLNRYSDVKLSANPSKAQINEAWKSASKKVHPDVGGTIAEQTAVNTAKDYLLGKEVTPTKVEPAEGKQAQGEGISKQEEGLPKREVIKLEKEIEGVKTASAVIRPDKTAGLSVEVEEEARGKGVGTEAAKVLEKQLIEKGVRKVDIDAFTEARGFWKKQGYKVSEGAKEIFGMIKMEKELKEVTKAPTVEAPTVPEGDLRQRLIAKAQQYKSAQTFSNKLTADEFTSFDSKEELKAFFEKHHAAEVEEEEGEVTTAREAAKKLIRTYVERGDSFEELKESHLGESGADFTASIGGYMGGKRVSPTKIQVSEIGRKKVEETFSLRELYDEIKEEVKAPPTEKEPSTELEKDIKDLNKPLNQELAEKEVTETVAGKRENYRYDTQGNIDLAGVFPEGTTPESKVNIYRAGTSDIEPGQYVSVGEKERVGVKRADYWQKQRGGQVFVKVVPISDLVRTSGLRMEAIYSPKKEVKGVEEVTKVVKGAAPTAPGVFPEGIKAPTRIAFTKALDEKKIYKTLGGWGSAYWQVKGEPDPNALKLKGMEIDKTRFESQGKSIDEMFKDKEMTPVTGFEVAKDTTFRDKDIVVFYADGIRTFANKIYVDAVRKYYPDATVKLLGEDAAIGFYEGDKLVGALMPITIPGGMADMNVKERYGKVPKEKPKETEKPPEKPKEEKPKELTKEEKKAKIEKEVKREPEEKADHITRAEVRPEELPHPIPEGEEPSRVPEKRPAGAAKGVRGEPAGGEAGIRERPPTRVTAKDQIAVNKEVEKLVAERSDAPDKYSKEEKNLLRQYTGVGGLEKGGGEGRGLLDEYYTPKKLVDFVWKQLREEYLPKVGEAGVRVGEVLEPAVGIGRFFEPIADISLAGSGGYEINATSATISKILFPDTNIRNAPFESLFVNERGIERLPSGWKRRYDVVVGNPPYGEHRGRYLGLGEEPKIKKYEEYFLKRGLDTLDKNGMLAYVMPSSFLRSATNYAKEEIGKLGRLEAAYRFPNGVFGTTDIGTDVVFFRKGGLTDPRFISDDRYFEQYPSRILGKVRKGAGRWGADVVEGTLEKALELAEGKVRKKEVKVTERPPAVPRGAVPKLAKKDTARVKAPKEIEKALKKKVVITSKKKDKQISLSKVSAEDKEMWSNVEVTGELNIEYVKKRFGDVDLKDFKSKGIAVEVGSTNRFFPNILYYQGNIYEKLDALESRRDDLNPEQYEWQKSNLEKVLPKPQAVSSINLKPNDHFVKELTTTEGTPLIAEFESWLGQLPRDAFGGSSSWEIRGYISGSIVNTGDKLRNILVRKRRREVGDRLFNRYLREGVSAAEVSKIEDTYNRTFNAYHRPDYKQIPVLEKINGTFKDEPLKVRDLQREGAAFLASKGVGLLGHEVGLGKTMTSIIALNETMARGWTRKPLVVVPNSTYKQWVQEFTEVVPNVTINSLYNLGGKFKGDLSTLEIEDGTVSLMTYEGLTKLGFRMETYDQLTRNLRDVMAGVSKTKRARAKEGEEISQMVGTAIKGTTGERFFEDLGFDHITIDEAHNFKNIFARAVAERGEGNEYRNVRGSTSARGVKAYLMTQYILENNNNRNVFLLSATPFTNSPMEIYSILSLMAKKRLEGLGLRNVNDFMSMFMDMRARFVVKADQTVREQDEIERFNNLQQLQKLVTEFIDFRTGEEVGIPRPNRTKKTQFLSPTRTQADFISKAQSLFKPINGGPIVAITELQNITLSPYLSRFNTAVSTYKGFVESSPKIKFAVEAVSQVRKDNKKVGQIIYMPRGVEHFALLKEYLVKEKGFDRDQIGIIKGGMSIDQKASVQKRFNEGKVKVLIGTEAIKEGVNLQEKATDMYHLHLPWNPTDMLQVEGRIWRQGNDWKNVRITYPLVENSVDSFIFQKLETKEKRIKNLWSYKGDSIPVGDLDFEDMKLDLITDPVIRARAEQTFETAKANRKLETLKVEKAFAGRKIGALESIQSDIERFVTGKKGAMERGAPPEDIEYYTTQIQKNEKKLAKLQAAYKKQGIDVEALKARTTEFEENIKAQEKEIEDLKEKYKKKIEEAKERRISVITKPNNYAKMMADIAEENKTFFVKRKIFKGRRERAVVSTPKGAANFYMARIPESAEITNKITPAKSPEELQERITQLNKFAQSHAILRRIGKIRRKKAAGEFVHPGKFKYQRGVPKEGEVRLRGKYIANEQDYVGVLAHELGHAIEYHITGTTNEKTQQVFGRNLDSKTLATIGDELLAITKQIVGETEFNRKQNYYKKPSELFARFVEKRFVSPGDIGEIAPTVARLFEAQSVRHPIIREFLEAAMGEIDKGHPKFAFLGDLRQTYQKHLGKRVGNIAYDEEVTHRAMQERAKYVIENFVKKRFKGVKDDPALLFRTAESIMITKGGKPEFGTRDFVLAKTEEEATKLKEEGWEEVDMQVENGTAYPVYARQRYSEEEGRAMFESLSPEGKKLIKDFTAQRAEAKDYFNREIIKDVAKIESRVEGWVHHYFEKKPSTIGKRLKFREKRAGARMRRKGKEGYVEDFQKAMTKAMVDLEGEKVYNDFITRQFARVTKPIPNGKSPDAGWVEIVGDVRKGAGLRQEKKILIVKGGKKFIPKRARYQMPKEIYERYKLWRGLVQEASTAVKVVNDINRYWRVNILAHLGTAGTNFISGGIQYSTKVLTDFYTETLTGNVGYEKTKKNISAMLKVLLPRGWYDAPDWIYGSDQSNWYGQFTDQPTASKAISTYGDKALKVFGTYERYWKKVISLSEGARNLRGLEKMTIEGLRLPTKEERALIADINREVDLYAYDYDNVPAWLEAHQRSAVGQMFKPFAKYPYKYAKQITGLAGAIFDRSLPWQERVAKLLALATVMALYAAYSDRRKQKQQTPEGTPEMPARVSTRGRLFIKAVGGKELFLRVSKYPFINLTEAGMHLVNKEWESAKDILDDTLGSIGPVAEMVLLAKDYRSKYDRYTPVPVVLGESLATYMPLYRVLTDISRMFDPYRRKQLTFKQAFTQLIPTTSADLQEKLHGEKRVVRVPVEGKVRPKLGESRGRTTTDVTLKNYWQDILIGMLSGLYITRIDPKEAEAFILREEKLKKERKRQEEREALRKRILKEQ